MARQTLSITSLQVFPELKGETGYDFTGKETALNALTLDKNLLQPGDIVKAEGDGFWIVGPLERQVKEADKFITIIVELNEGLPEEVWGGESHYGGETLDLLLPE